MRIWEKIDKFYLVLIGILIPVAVLMAFSFKTIFSAFFLASDLSEKNIGSEVKIDKEKFDEAYNWIKSKKVSP